MRRSICSVDSVRFDESDWMEDAFRVVPLANWKNFVNRLPRFSIELLRMFCDSSWYIRRLRRFTFSPEIAESSARESEDFGDCEIN